MTAASHPHTTPRSRGHRLSQRLLALLVISLTITTVLALNVTAAHADSSYDVALCGYNAVPDQAPAWWDFNTSPVSASVCDLTDARSGPQAAGTLADTVYNAPAAEAITAVAEYGSHYWASHTAADEYWSVGLGTDLGGSDTFYHQLGDCSNNSSTHIYTYSGANSLTTGCNNSLTSAGANGLWAYNVGLIASCHASTCPSNGGSGATLNGLVVALDDPNNAPTTGVSGSLWNAANGSWISGLNDTTSLSMNFSASDPSTVCTLTADLVDSNGNAVASDQPVATTNWDGATFAAGDPCASNPSATFSPNLANLATGTYYLNTYAQNAGNIQNGGGAFAQGAAWTQGAELRVDNTPPTQTLTSSAAANTWSATPQTVTVDASDVGSGVDSVDCAGPGAPANAIPVSQLPYTITVSQSGSDTITCQAVDNAGNLATPSSVTVNIDSTTPTVQFSTNADSSRWYPSASSIPQVSVSGTTGPSGISSFTCSGDGIATQNYASASGGTIDLTGLDQGAGTITCTLTSNSGLITSMTQTLNLDSTAPDVGFATTASSSLWYTNANLPAVTVNASTTGGSGVDHITCSGDGLPSPYTITGSSGTIPNADLNQGAGQITCASTSGAGVVSAPQAQTINIDNTIPTATLTSSANPNAWYPSGAAIPAVSVSTTAGPSGIADITCQAPGQQDTITAASGTVDLSTLRSGQDTISCTPMSPTGVQGTPATLTVQVDSQTPIVSFSGPASSTAWYPSVSAIPALNVDASTGPSGLASIDCHGDGISQQTQSTSGASLSLAGLDQGSGQVTCVATSQAGVVGSAQSFQVNLDSTAPTAQWNTSESQTTWYPSTGSLPDLGVQATTSGPSGVDHITCSGGGFNTPATIQGSTGDLHPSGFAQGSNTITCVPYSGAGVAGAPITRTVLIDATAPAVQLSAPDSATWYPTAQTVTADASGDTNPSGVQSIACSVDANASTTTVGDHATQTASGDGVHTVACHAVSGAGISGAPATTTVKVDSQTPSVTQAVVAAGPTQPTGTVTVDVAGSEADALSGIASTSCSLDDQPATLVSGDHQTVNITTAGAHTLSCSAVTGAGLVSAISTQTYQVQPSATQFSLQYDSPASAWQSAAVQLPVKLAGATAQDYSSMTCTVPGQDPTTISGTSGTINVQGSGSHQVACYATAANGADTAAVTQTVRIDTQTPTGTFSTRDTSTGAQITLLGAEQTPLSGIASETCTLDGGASQTATGPQLTVAVTGNGTHHLACSITTAAGITAQLSDTANISVPVLAPVEIAAPDPTRWYRSAQSVLLGVPSGGPVIASMRCTQQGVATTYPVSTSTTSVTVPAGNGTLSCVDVDPSGQQSPPVALTVNVDTTAPSGTFLKTGPNTAVATVSDQGPSGIQGVTIEYQVGSSPWATIPGAFDPTTGQIVVSLPSALQVPGVSYALRAIAVNNAGAQTIITTMTDGSPATATVPTSGSTSTPVHARPIVQAGLQLAAATPAGAAHLPQTLTVAYGQAVRLTGSLRAGGPLAGQAVKVRVTPALHGRRRLTVYTNAAGRFSVNLGAGPDRTATYTVASVSRTVTILVRGKLGVRIVSRGRQRALRVLAAGASSPVLYRLQLDVRGVWHTIGRGHMTNRRGLSTIQLPRIARSAAPAKLRVLIKPQHGWRYLTAAVNA